MARRLDREILADAPAAAARPGKRDTDVNGWGNAQGRQVRAGAGHASAVSFVLFPWRTVAELGAQGGKREWTSFSPMAFTCENDRTATKGARYRS